MNIAVDNNTNKVDITFTEKELKIITKNTENSEKFLSDISTAVLDTRNSIIDNKIATQLDLRLKSHNSSNNTDQKECKHPKLQKVWNATKQIGKGLGATAICFATSKVIVDTIIDKLNTSKKTDKKKTSK